jgi:ribosomal protein S18 acetylase RimI-like enzyme
MGKEANEQTARETNEQAGKGFVIEEVTDLDAVWPELELLVLGIIEYHRPWDQRALKSGWAAIMRDYMARCLTLVARNEAGKAVGFLSGTVGPDVGIFEGVVGHIDNAFVIESARRRGVGQALTEQFEARCREQGAGEVRLDVAEGNELGLGFWRRSGYEVTMHAMRKPLEARA